MTKWIEISKASSHMFNFHVVDHMNNQYIPNLQPETLEKESINIFNILPILTIVLAVSITLSQMCGQMLELKIDLKISTSLKSSLDLVVRNIFYKIICYIVVISYLIGKYDLFCPVFYSFVSLRNYF